MIIPDVTEKIDIDTDIPTVFLKPLPNIIAEIFTMSAEIKRILIETTTVMLDQDSTFTLLMFESWQ